MITLKQAKKVLHGDTLTQADVDQVNRYNGGLKLAADYAMQYYWEMCIEAKRDKDFRINAYGN